MNFGSVSFNKHSLSTLEGRALGWVPEDTEGRRILPARKELRNHQGNKAKDFGANPSKESGITILHKNET